MKKIYILALFSIFCYSCGSSTSPTIVVYTGITHTYENGIVASYDYDDWKKVEAINSNFFLEPQPAAPNPCLSITSINFLVSDKMNLAIYIKSNDKKVRTLKDTIFAAGTYSINYDLKDDSGNKLQDGIYRVFFEVEHKYITYGDLQILTPIR